MKHPILLSCIITLSLAGSAYAQSSLPPRRQGGVAPKPRVAAATGTVLKDGLTMQKGRVVITETGITNPLQGDKKLLNGTTISTTGLVTTPSGTTTQMTEGDEVSLTGRINTRASIMAADSIAKIQLYDAKYPGKRKKAEAERERKAKDLAKAEERKEKAKAKAKK